jgi:hypothetical protein
VVVDNRAGAGGMIGAEAAAAMPADGYNLFYTVKAVMAIAPHLYPHAKYNPLRDFKAVSEVLIVPHIITATPNAPYNTMAEMVAYAKRNPGKVNYASAGRGVAAARGAGRVGQAPGHQAHPRPVQDPPVARRDERRGDMYLEASTTAIPSIQGKRIKALAVSGAERVPALPDVPTMTEFNPELDPKGVVGNSWHTFFAPAGTPDDIVAKLNTEIVKIVKTAGDPGAPALAGPHAHRHGRRVGQRRHGGRLRVLGQADQGARHQGRVRRAMIVEQRTYTLKPLRTQDFLALYERAALPLQKKYLGHLVGFFTSELGPLNQVVHLWAFDSLAERERRRKAMEEDPAWPLYTGALRELDVILQQETRMLRSTSFSPL